MVQLNEAWKVAKASGDEDYTKFKAKWFQDEKRRKAQEAQAQAEAEAQEALRLRRHRCFGVRTVVTSKPHQTRFVHARRVPPYF